MNNKHYTVATFTPRKCLCRLTAAPLLSLLIIISSSLSIHGEEIGKSDWKLSAGLVAINSPLYQGSEERRFLIVPNLMATYKDQLRINPRGIRFKFNKKGRAQYGIRLGWNFGRDEDDNNKLIGLGDIDMAITGTSWVRFSLDPKELFSSKFSLTHDLNDAYGGYTIKSELSSKVFIPGVKAFGNVSIHAIYGSESYNMVHYGIDEGQALTSPDPKKELGAGFNRMGLSTMLFRPLNTKWMVNLRLSYDRIIGEASEAAFLDTDDLFSGAFSVNYSFY